jgi:hypothetical protein
MQAGTWNWSLVDGEAALQTVCEIAASTPGVRRVVNHIVVRHPASTEERRIEARIMRAWGQPGDAATPVDAKVAVTDGVAFVWGVPPSQGTDLARDPACAPSDWRVVTRRSRPDLTPGDWVPRRRAG